MSQYITTKEQWDSTTVPQRVASCQYVGLTGKVGSKSWEALTANEQLALTGTNVLADLLGMRDNGEEIMESATISQAEQEYWDNKLAGMRSVASDIVSQILVKNK